MLNVYYSPSKQGSRFYDYMASQNLTNALRVESESGTGPVVGSTSFCYGTR